ncbi:hypothetical protein [Formosa algae]|uniref:Uncharacterized protein n=3 Tax=Formosa algae TaxID=225843 RepID=A0A9X0YI95_9FLAO|nr:hypothetical protein [Formosa algae]MBP1838840.1 hypothetical protein [Formosa algae]MDQ0333617.1 hypothetical protein [Formosa algae]
MVIAIQKEQNVIKLFFILLLFLGSIKMYGQEKVEGKYCVDNGIKSISKCLILKKNKKFNIIFNEHLNNKSNLSGNWFYKNNTLTLIYKEPEFRKTSKISVSSLEEINDSVRIIFRVKDFNHGPMLGLNIKILPENLNYITNQKGEKELIFKKSTKSIYGYTEYLGYERCYFSLDLSKNQIIEIFIDEHFEYDINKSSVLNNFMLNKKSFYTINEIGEKIKWVKYNPKQEIKKQL